MFNLLPSSIINVDGNKVEQIKSKLDTFLRLIPDQPSVPAVPLARGRASSRDKLSPPRNSHGHNYILRSDHSVENPVPLVQNFMKYQESVALEPEKVSFSLLSAHAPSQTSASTS